MIRIMQQEIWFEGDPYLIRFSDTSLNDPDEMPGMQLLDVDGLERHQLPSRVWDFARAEMDTQQAEEVEEAARW